jgi:hypothetical protein
MSDLRAVTWTAHNNLRWMKPSSFAFAARDNLVMIGLHEVAKVMMQLPIGFIRHKTAFVPVALMGVLPGQNLVISPHGKWLADYIPALYRSYPFRMADNGDGKFALCIDHASDLVHDKIAGFRFFEDEKKPSQETSAIINLLIQLETDRAAQGKICALLDELGLFEAWPLKVQAAEGIQQIPNLYRINETRLNELPAEALFALRNAGGLALVYGHLFSMQQIQHLASVAQRKSWASKAEQSSQAPQLNIGEEEGIVSFANL